MKIIIAADISNSLKKIELILINHRHNILKTDGKQLIEKTLEFQPDLFIIDRVNGYKNCIEIRKLIKFRYTPVIIVSDKNNQSEELKAYKSGATDYINENISAEILLSKLKNILKLKTLQTRLYKKNRELIQLTAFMKQYLPGDLQLKILKKKFVATPSTKPRKKFFAIFFSDIRNFTELSTHYTPEEMLDLLNCYLYFTYDRIISAGGKIDKVIGDAILAVFDEEDSGDEPCFSAVKAAFEIQEEMRSFNELMEQSPKFTSGNVFPFIQLGIGINYDEIVQGNLGTPDRMDFTVIGDGVNMASRCQHLALGEEIIITQSVYDRIKDRVEIEILPLADIKGKKEKIQLYRVVGLI